MSPFCFLVATNTKVECRIGQDFNAYNHCHGASAEFRIFSPVFIMLFKDSASLQTRKPMGLPKKFLVPIHEMRNILSTDVKNGLLTTSGGVTKCIGRHFFRFRISPMVWTLSVRMLIRCCSLTGLLAMRRMSSAYAKTS